jgi:hypothetical protein
LDTAYYPVEGCISHLTHRLIPRISDTSPAGEIAFTGWLDVNFCQMRNRSAEENTIIFFVQEKLSPWLNAVLLGNISWDYRITIIIDSSSLAMIGSHSTYLRYNIFKTPNIFYLLYITFKVTNVIHLSESCHSIKPMDGELVVDKLISFQMTEGLECEKKSL